MIELEILQDISLEIYGVSLADISLETFEHLQAIVWAMSVVRTALLDDTNLFDELVSDDLEECPACDCLYDGCCCENCGFADIHEESNDQLKGGYCCGNEGCYADCYESPQDEEPEQEAEVCEKCGYTRLSSDSQLYFVCRCHIDSRNNNMVELFCQVCGHRFVSLSVLDKCPLCEEKEVTYKVLHAPLASALWENVVFSDSVTDEKPMAEKVVNIVQQPDRRKQWLKVVFNDHVTDYDDKETCCGNESCTNCSAEPTEQVAQLNETKGYAACTNCNYTYNLYAHSYKCPRCYHKELPFC